MHRHTSTPHIKFRDHISQSRTHFKPTTPATMSDRSASPAREEPRAKKQKTGGFKWKEKKPRDEESSNARDSGRLERGYRDRSPRRDSYRERERDKDRSPRRERNEDGYRDREARRATDSYKPRDRDRDFDREGSKAADLDSKFAGYKSRPSNKDSTQEPPSTTTTTSSTEPKKEKKKKPKSTTPSEPMILVTVNDRLGTKAQIPCLPSDNVKAFKALVAAHIGRQPHEIMLKRQGERPFKDQLTLQDYGVSNGVQLDLELDTGD